MSEIFVQWNPREYLSEVPYDRARLSLGFLRAQMQKLFPKLLEYWKPLFLSLGLDEPIVRSQLLIEPNSIPTSNGITGCYQVNSTSGYVHIDHDSVASINKALADHDFESFNEILVSYLARRFLVTLEKTWAGKENIRISYSDILPDSPSDFSAKAIINIELNNHLIKVVFGIAIPVVELINSAVLGLQKSKLDHRTEISIELFGLNVPAEMLIDYLRPGTVIKSPNIFSDNVNLYANGRPWAQGVLKTCQDKFAVELTSFVSQRPQGNAGQTRISVELEPMVLEEDFSSYQTPGAIMLTDIRFNSPVSVVVSGEKIANALMGVSSENKPLLRLLSKN